MNIKLILLRNQRSEKKYKQTTKGNSKTQAWKAWNKGITEGKKEMEGKNKPATFYIIWTSECNAPNPKVTHWSYEAAQTEAERLAKQYPFQDFFVMEAKALSKAKQEITVKTINL